MKLEDLLLEWVTDFVKARMANLSTWLLLEDFMVRWKHSKTSTHDETLGGLETLGQKSVPVASLHAI